MKLTNNQREILAYLRTVPQATIHEIYYNISVSYYCNYEKNLGTVLSRLVKGGFITRVKPGVFKIGGSMVKTVEPNPKQLILL